jgi:acyl carrier protein
MTRQEIASQIKQLLIDTLSLDLSVEDMDDDMLLLGDIPEFDSMAIVSVITAIEEFYGINLEDEELSAEIFETVEALVDFVESKL